MALPVARTRDEAHLYMDMRPCVTCGKSDVPWETALTSDDGVPARRYSGNCPGCGAAREFVFRLPARPLLPSASDVVLFGDEQPSELLDAGEWLYVAEVCAQAAAGGPEREPGAGEPFSTSGVPAGQAALAGAGRNGFNLSAEARESLIVAVAAIEEVLKFIPEGRDEVPRAGFWSERGRTYRQTEPGEFRRQRLLAVRSNYRDALVRAAAS